LQQVTTCVSYLFFKLYFVTVTDSVERQYTRIKYIVTAILATIPVVCTTAHVWTSHNRSFFGTTVHWIDEQTSEKKYVALACSRLSGSHKYGVLDSTLENIHANYKIGHKVVTTATDNGSNFVKAFSEFGETEHSALTA
jgi:hypothetical protein